MSIYHNQSTHNMVPTWKSYLIENIRSGTLVTTAFAIYIQSTGNLYVHNHKSSPKTRKLDRN